MKCECGREYKQEKYDGEIPNYCPECGRKLDAKEDFIKIVHGSTQDHGEDYQWFATGRLEGKKLDVRFDDDDRKITEFPKNEYKVVKTGFLYKLLEMVADGQITVVI